MPKLDSFSTPAKLPDPNAADWSARVERLFAKSVRADRPQFYDPTKSNTPPGSERPIVSWVAFPAALRASVPSPHQRWKLADEDRLSFQDEYCEWTVARSGAKITKVTFTTEVPEYWEHLFETAPDQVVALYQELVDPRVKQADLQDSEGNYQRQNRWNNIKPGRLAHLIQPASTLSAAVELVAAATVARVKNGVPVTNQQELVRCAQLGNPLRNSDPQISAAANAAARAGDEVSLADPLGLYLGRPLTSGIRTPDNADAAEFWKIERGHGEHVVRARFEVPANRGYLVGDIEIDGRPVEFGGQIADRVQVTVKPIVKSAHHALEPKPCK